MSSPQGVDADTRFLSLSAGWNHTCGIKADGRAACWGGDDDRQTDPASSPQGVDADTRFLALSAGGGPSDDPGNAAGGHSCGIKADGRVACWGSSAEGQTDPASAAGVDADARFLAVSSGALHSCGIKTDGAAACWGNDGDGQASPPSDSFARTPDVIRLAESATILTTQDGGEAVRFNEVVNIEVLRFQLMLDEGETTALTLFNVLNAPANPVTVALEIDESDERFLSFNPERLTVSEAGELMTTVTAVDNDEFALISPIHAMPNGGGGSVRFIPDATVTVTIENDDIYTVGFEREAITLEEGRSANARLIIDPAILSSDTVTVALSVSDTGQITVSPEEPVFDSATGASLNFVLSVIDDNDVEGEESSTVYMSVEDDINPPTRLSTDTLIVTVPAHEEGFNIKIRVYLEGALP